MSHQIEPISDFEMTHTTTVAAKVQELIEAVNHLQSTVLALMSERRGEHSGALKFMGENPEDSVDNL